MRRLIEGTSVAILVALMAVPALAQPRGNAGTAGNARGRAGQAATPTPRAPTAYQQAIQQGVRLMLARDFDGAIAALRQGVQAEPSNPEAFYYIAEAQRMKGDMTEAVEAFRNALRIAQQANHPRFQARALQGIADTLERIEGRTSDARTAWTEYGTFADSHRDVSVPEVPRGRTQAIDTMTTQETAYVAVRQRIEDRVRENAANPPRPAPRAR